ncbi:MAG: hypothetical protein H7Y01_13505 [Ferruginibacter sp.]|nr:hypothetical protein [Chitinophagaceae bacterium]
MKNYYCTSMIKAAIVLTISSFLSCSRSPSQITPPSAFFKFTADLSLYQWNGVPGDGNTCFLCGSDITKMNGYYVLRSSDPRNYGNVILLKIPAITLSETVYTLTTINSTTSPNANHHINIGQALPQGSPFPSSLFAADTEPGDYATITITSIHDGIYADGTFTARMTLAPYGPTANKLDITGGEFRNVKIL